MILCIETATKNCSVALIDQGEILASKELNDGGYSHGEFLHVFIKELMELTGTAMSDLQAVAVSKGPGSYTGLRIGVSAAKGICFSVGCPLISVNTLEVLAAGVKETEGLRVGVLDARRDEVYRAVYDTELNIVEETSAHVLTKESFKEYKEPLIFIGDATEKVSSFVGFEGTVFYPKTFPTAMDLGRIAEKKFELNQFEDVAYFEPFYLKDFKVTPSKK